MSLGDIARKKFGVDFDSERPYKVQPRTPEQQAKYDEYAKKVFAEIDEQVISPNKFMALLKIYAKKVVPDYDWNLVKPYASMLFQYCTMSPKWDKEGSKLVINNPSLDKGIMLVGPPGCGKTMLVHIFNHISNRFGGIPNPINGRMVSANTISSDFGIGGHEGISQYFEHDLVVDDMGTEDLAVHYGDRVEVMRILIEQRYISQQRSKQKMHCSTNMTPEELGNRYGIRVRSRVREMFNIIPFDGKDLRQ